MLYQMEVENFYSIRDKQTVDLRLASNVPDSPGRFASLWSGSTDRAPKVTAFFGPNASGKSTVLRALSFLAWFVKDSFQSRPNELLPFNPFNSAKARFAPTRLSVSLGGLSNPEDVQSSQCRYTYTFEVVRYQGGRQHVTSETLHYWPEHSRRKVRLFERDETGIKNVSADFIKVAAFRQTLDKILRPNVSVISTLAQLNHPFSTSLCEVAGRVLSNVETEHREGVEDEMVRHYDKNPALLDALNKEIKRIDLGIHEVRILQGPSSPVIVFDHVGHDGPLPIQFESHGTRTFLKLYPYLLHALETGGIALVDEIDTAIHPIILPEIIRWFHDPVRNPHNAQLWMTAHNASLLEELIKEEILFCSKSHDGRTEIYALQDVQSVRRDDNYYRKYLGGTYGAIPSIG